MTSALSFQNTNTNTSGTSFQGVSSGIQTSQLVQSQIAQASLPMKQLQATQAANTNRSGALSSMQSQMSALGTSISTMNNTGFQARVVTSTDPSNAYVSATAAGGASGTYTLQVQQTATQAELAPTLETAGPNAGNPLGYDPGDGTADFAVASNTTPVFADPSGLGATFALQGTDGITRKLTLGDESNTISGLAAAINNLGTADPNDPTSKGLGITATVVNTGSGPTPYQLILKSNQTGTGPAGNNLTIAQIPTPIPPPPPGTPANAVPPPPPVQPANLIGIGAGDLDASGNLTGGTQSNQASQDAKFTLDGVQLTRPGNTVTDAADGITFNLLQGKQAGSTTLTVAPDTATATTQMQAIVSSFNTLVQTYNSDAMPSGPLAGDFATQSLISQIHTALTGAPSGLPAGAKLNSASSLGLSTQEDGTLTLDASKFAAAFKADPAAAQNVFANSGVSTNPGVTFTLSGPKTVSGTLQFGIASVDPGGAVDGTITTPDGTSYSTANDTLSGSNGVLKGMPGTQLDGLYLSVSGTGTGSLTLSKGVGQATIDTIAGMTNKATGIVPQLLTDIHQEDKDLATQIKGQQTMLSNKQTSLENKYSQMESTLSQLRDAGQSITSV